MEAVSDCNVEGDISGAMFVSVFFLIVFVILLAGDGLVTWFALNRAIRRNQKMEAERKTRIAQLDEQISQRVSDLRYLNGSFAGGMRGGGVVLPAELCQRLVVSEGGGR